MTDRQTLRDRLAKAQADLIAAAGRNDRDALARAWEEQEAAMADLLHLDQQVNSTAGDQSVVFDRIDGRSLADQAGHIPKLSDGTSG